MQKTDVLIVGLGPTGATLANLLGLCGVQTVVLEKESSHYELPRAVHFDDEVMRVFQTVGISDALIQKIRVNPGMQFVDADGELLLDWPRPSKLSGQGWHPSYRFHQPDLEELLCEQLEHRSTVTVKRQTQVTGIQQNRDSVDVMYQPANSDSVSDNSINCKYLIGCDGANSFVRNHLKLAVDDLGFNERWLVIDLLLKKNRDDLGDKTQQFCNPARPSTYVRCPGNRRRWEITVLPTETDKQVRSDEFIWGQLSRWITEADALVERSAVYTFQSILATQWRINRCFLAGDAAHLTPPFMGQGMCGGIRDAANLAWKLARCVQYTHDEALLDSYQSERYPHMRYYIHTAMTLGTLINAAGTKEALQSSLLNPDGSAKMKSVIPQLGQSILVEDKDPSGVLCSQPTLNNNTKSDDVSGYSHTLFVDSTLSDSLEHSDTQHCFVVESKKHPEVEKLLESYQCHAILVRPDRYISGIAKNDVDLKALLQSSYNQMFTL